MTVGDPLDWQRVVQHRANARLGRPVLYRETVDSTNALAHQLVPDPATRGAVIVTGHQTAGRGRLARSWVTPAGAALTCTVVLGPLAPVWAVPMAVGLAALDATLAQGVPGSLKWPNDLLIGTQKCGGILIEAHQVADQAWLLAGIGINVHGVSQELPLATALANHAPKLLSRTTLLLDLLDALERWEELVLRDPAAVRAAWKARLVTLGQVVHAQTPGGVVEGLAYDITADGALLLHLEDGSSRAIHAGDVTLSPAPRR